MDEKETQIERTQVEYVFGLTGGELDDGPTPYTYEAEGYDISDHTHKMMTKSGHFSYTMDGVPDYLESEYKDDAFDNEYFTAVQFCLWGLPPDEVTIKGKLYKQVAHYVSSGETECVYSQCDDGPKVTLEQSHRPWEGSDRRECPYCCADVGDEHGYIYLGDGWAEVIYRHATTQAMRDCAARHNIQVWAAPRASTVCTNGDCGCEAEQPKQAASYYCVECNAAAECTGIDARDSYWWQTCAAGCLPDSDVTGPFRNERDALEDATNGLE